LNEALIIQAAKEGNRAAFTQIVEQYQHLVYNTVLGIVQQHEEAEDTAQEVFYRFTKACTVLKAIQNYLPGCTELQ